MTEKTFRDNSEALPSLATPEIQNLRSPESIQAAHDILEQGFSFIEIGPEDQVTPEVEAIFNTSADFFKFVEEKGLTDENVYRYRNATGGPATMSGTRLLRLSDEYADRPDQPDLCNTIAFMEADLNKIPNPQDFLQLEVIQQMLVYRERVHNFAQGILDELAEYYGGRKLSIEPHSFLDSKHYPANDSPLEYRQKAHTDDGLLTIGLASQPGLQLLDVDGAVIHAGAPSPFKVIVMPGDVLTNMTGGFDEGEPAEGAIRPQIHEVLNYRELPRDALYSFVFPDVTQITEPWVTTKYNETINISQLANESQAQFGMAYLEDPKLVPPTNKRFVI